MIWIEICSVWVLEFSECSGTLDNAMSENVPESLMVLIENCCADLKSFYRYDSPKLVKEQQVSCLCQILKAEIIHHP